MEGFARNIRRTLSVLIRNACFYWIISKVVAQIFQRKSSFKNLSDQIEELYLFSLETLRKRNDFQILFCDANDHLLQLDHVNVRKRLQKKSSYI